MLINRNISKIMKIQDLTLIEVSKQEVSCVGYCKANTNLHIWATSWQNQQCGCAPSEDSDQPGHPPSLIRVFAGHMKKAWDLSYLLSTQRRLWSDRTDAQADLSLRWVQSFCWFCNEAAHIYLHPWIFASLEITHKMIKHVANKDFDMSLITRKPVFGVCDQVRLKWVCSATGTS